MSTRPFYAINIGVLLALYGIVPIVFLLMFIDYVYLEQTLKRHLPEDPNKWWLWAFLFNWPHILASFTSFADKAYWAVYKTRLIAVFSILTAVVISLYGLLPLYSKALAYHASMAFLVFYMAYTVHHVLSQQLGLCRGFLNLNAPWLFTAWRGCNIAAGVSIYLLVFGENWLNSAYIFGLGSPGGGSQGLDLQDLVVLSMRIFSTLACLLGCILLWLSLKNPTSTVKARAYLLANIAMMLLVWLAMEWSYAIFVIAIPRLLHDITAFIIYACHDANRNHGYRFNYLYRALAFLPLSPWLLCPLLAIGFANSLEAWIPWLIQANFILAMAHYYFEAIIWKQGRIHRKQLRFV